MIEPPGCPPPSPALADRVLDAVDRARDEIVDFTAELVRVPTVNPPGAAYAECAEVIGRRLARCGFEVSYHVADGRPEHSAAHPRVNVLGVRRGNGNGRAIHLNGHFDVVPAGEGWTLDPFGGIVRDGRIYGRGACDMKAGLAAAVYAAEALRRAGIPLRRDIEVSGTVDEESGGWAGVAWLAERGLLTRHRTEYVIIPEPMNVDRVCVGHRGAYWFELVTRGRIAHGSMPFLGTSAIAHMGTLLQAIHGELAPRLARRRTAVPVVPDGARHATINVNAVMGGQAGQAVQTPCVADRCSAIVDRRFLLEEGFDAARQEIVELLDELARRVPGFDCELRDLMVVEPTLTPAGSPLTGVLQARIRDVVGREAAIVASPGTYDHKHVTRIGGIEHCVAYGPGILDLAHQPDEWCGIDDLVNATKVLALALLDLAGGG